MKKNTKAQVAVETLLIYGVTILIVMLAIGALIGFGVLDLGGILPEKCAFKPQQFACSDYTGDATANTVTVEMTNNVGQTIDAVRIDNIEGPSACQSTVVWPTSWTPAIDSNGDGDFTIPLTDTRGSPWVNGEPLLVTFTCPGVAGGAKTDFTFDLVYRYHGKDLDHHATAEVQINVKK